MRWILSAALLLTPALVLADPAEPSQNAQANAHFHAGLAAYGKQNYAAASDEFHAAYKLDPVPALLWSWAQSERLGGHCDRALPLYRKYLYADISQTQVGATRENISICEKDSPTPPSANPGEPMREGGYRWYRDKLADGLTAAGVLGIAVGIVYFSKASSTRSKADSAMFLDDFKSSLDDATTERRVGALSLTLGVGLAATGAALYVIHGRAHRHRMIAGTDGHSIFIGAHF